MERNLRKKLNNYFIHFVCGICLDNFEADEYVYEITYEDGELACGNCVKETEDEIVKRIDEKMDFLKRSKKLLLK